MKFILMEISPSVIWVLGIIVTIVISVISGLVKYSLTLLRNMIDKMEQENRDDHQNFTKYIKELEKEDQSIKSTINDVNLKILVEVNSIAVKLAEYKRDFKN